LLDETKSFSFVKPFYFAGCLVRHNNVYLFKNNNINATKAVVLEAEL
jgi:hypothetical protein